MSNMVTKAEITQAVAVLRAGGLVAFPTETVYGLGADATNEAAVGRVFAAKGRPRHHPLIVHLASAADIPQWATHFPAAAQALAGAFWPGPLTLILKKQAHVLDCVTGGQDTVGLRVPQHPVALALLQAFGGGLVAPSANQFTHLSPTTAQAVQQELGEQVDGILDGGACTVGIESTIVDMSGAFPVMLRPGMISLQALEQVLGMPVREGHEGLSAVRAPGMHPLHYAPRTKVVLLSTADMPVYLQSLPVSARVATLCLTTSLLTSAYRVTMPSQAEAYARVLYDTLRQLDQQGLDVIIIEQVPNTPDWAAIRDRLLKASGERT